MAPSQCVPMETLNCNIVDKYPEPKIKYIMEMRPIYPNKLEEKLHTNLAKAEVFGAVMRWRWSLDN